ncbi:MAG: helix-turn-helix transcriptional regulator [Umezawaea sp.]
MVTYEASCWLSLDPSTLMPTGHFAPQVGSAHLLDLAANEFLEDDVNKFADLARADPPVATVLAATGGEPGRSARFRDTLEPNGFGSGDELRAVFRTGGTAWGGVILHRHSGAFAADDVEVIAALGPVLAEGIRAVVLAIAAGNGAVADVPGTILLRRDDQIESSTAAAREWLAQIVEVSLEPGALPMVVAGVADRARRGSADGFTGAARARVPLRNGGWLLVHGAPLEDDPDGRVAITFAPTRQPDILDLIVGTYGLSPREREIALLVLAGLSTEEIASDAGISPYTVQDHLKSVFSKVGVHSRREFVAEVFLRHYAPQLASGQPGSTMTIQLPTTPRTR